MLSLKEYTTFGIGGVAPQVVVATDADALASARGIVLGRGSNVLVSDKGVDVPVIINRAGAISRSGDCVIVESGASLGAVCGFCELNGLGGMEWAVGIPGTVGGAIKTNAGAFGKSMATVTRHADVLRADKIVRLCNTELGFGYRTSAITDGDVVLRVCLSLTACDSTAITLAENYYRSVRRKKQPCGRSAGSVFKNPDGYYAAQLIESCGLKGAKFGGAIISEHANIIINYNNATSDDVYALMNLCAETVYNRYGILLKLEQVLIGDFDKNGFLGRLSHAYDV